MRAVRAFVAAFGREPEVAARAPGRVNLIGEHTDYNGGLVLPLAIDRDCVAAAGRSVDGRTTTVVAADMREDTGAGPGVWRCRLDDLARGGAARPTPTRGTWMSYAAGVFACVGEWLSGQRGGAGARVPAMNVAIASDVPLGAGLSSSAALEVSLARAIVEVCGGTWEPVWAAGACRRAEREYAGVPCGVMDQMIAACGVKGNALLIDCAPDIAGEARARRELVPMPREEEAVLLVVESGVRHALAGERSEYARRVAVTKSAAEKLGAVWLCELGPEEFAQRAGVLNEEERRCARHVVTEQARVRGAVAALRTGDLGILGRLINESHDSLRDDYRVSCKELDVIVESSRGVAGVYGARMTGGGFGGCAIVLMKPGSEGRVREAVARGLRECGVVEPRMFVTRACEGASLVTRTRLCSG